MNLEIGIGIFIIHVGFHIQVHAAQRIDHPDEALPVSHHVVMDRHLQKLLQRGDCQVHPAIGEGMTKLVIVAVPGNGHAGIAGNRQQADGAGTLVDAQQQHRVGTMGTVFGIADFSVIDPYEQNIDPVSGFVGPPDMAIQRQISSQQGRAGQRRRNKQKQQDFRPDPCPADRLTSLCPP